MIIGGYTYHYTYSAFPTSLNLNATPKDDTTRIGSGSSTTPKGKSSSIKNLSIPLDTKWYQEMMIKLKQTYTEYDKVTSSSIVPKVGKAWAPSQDITSIPKQDLPSQVDLSQIELQYF